MSSVTNTPRKPVSVSRTIGGKLITLETGKLAKQASGAVVVRIGDTMSLVATVTAKGREGLDFFPLTVDYREKVYSAGKFPGGYIKREGRPSTKEILTARLIDRPIRPLFPASYREEVQIQASPISADRQNDSDIISLIGASASLLLAQAPFHGPLSGVRLGRINGEFVVFPTVKEMAESDLDLIVASTRQKVAMIEGFGKELPEAEMLEAILLAHQYNQELNDLQDELLAACGLTHTAPAPDELPPLAVQMVGPFGAELRQVKQIIGKLERYAAVDAIQKKAIAAMVPDAETNPSRVTEVKKAFHAFEEHVVRTMILDGYRSDGRGPKDIRPISCEVSLLPCAHGSSLFQRGETQALVTTVLGTSSDEQKIDGVFDEYAKRFYLDYNMPSFSVGEVRPIRGPGRREIGHGMLAERSVAPIIPSKEDFPYTIRVISDILESNGSSSMASVCGATLSLMDAGVPISDPVGGISIGLVSDEKSGRFVLLTDIIGDEDHYGEMDFKVAGTQRGITGIQLDVKNHGLTEEIIRDTLAQAREARMEILRTMLRTIKRPREELSGKAPRLIQVQINPEKIGLLIGPGGKTIRRLEEETGAKIEVESSGLVTLSSPEAAAAEDARDRIQALTVGVQVGKIYEGKVIAIKDFGAFVEIMPGKDGLVHISELSDGYVQSVNEICRMGDTMLVKVIAVDEQDRVKLSRKAAMAERGIPDDRPPAPPRPPGSEPGRPSGGGGGSDRGGPPRRPRDRY
ncbi:MAG: polyribonucleotide nucleotidyltransferase [Planctomycetota bacterium]|nr:MAG: polyribonucleotide nucleotidyltransferase [Planctomycetota bacterium]